MARDSKERLDRLLVERGLAPSRARAQALVLAGKVIVGDARVDKPGTRIDLDAPIRLRGPDHAFVSRGGLKLDFALERFALEVGGAVALDAGASTGGFTDCLLQRGAVRVYALDVGRGQLHQRLRADARVVVMERCNVRALVPDDLGEPVDIAVLDLAFISLRLALPPVLACVRAGGALVPLVKPQFELRREQVGKGGIVRDEALQREAVEGIEAFASELGCELRGKVASPIRGADGNQEYLLHLYKP
ncbi:MAG: TlyA family RNA methyltransferase [Deltaproteobacteria bacterium]|nr:TlyA family RNA methyltransferase [Deltaproteobacteria bacterium]